MGLGRVFKKLFIFFFKLINYKQQNIKKSETSHTRGKGIAILKKCPIFSLILEGVSPKEGLGWAGLGADKALAERTLDQFYSCHSAFSQGHHSHSSRMQLKDQF